jgi:hypothetical protein
MCSLVSNETHIQMPAEIFPEGTLHAILSMSHERPSEDDYGVLRFLMHSDDRNTS